MDAAKKISFPLSHFLLCNPFLHICPCFAVELPVLIIKLPVRLRNFPYNYDSGRGKSADWR